MNCRAAPKNRGATVLQFTAELAKHGASLDTECDQCDFHADLPAGNVWKENGLHTLTEPHSNESGQTWKAAARADLIERMRFGTEPCTDPVCDICHPITD